MKQGEKGVVPFERPAAYWARKARKAYTPSRMTDAALMMRKALEQTGDGHVALELAAIYRSMHCISAAERYLMKAAAASGISPDLCFETGMCALERQEEALAENALDACIRMAPGSALAHEAQDVLENYPWSYQKPEKRTARSLAMSHFARTRLQKGDVKGARERAEAAWQRGKTGEAAILHGMLQKTPQEAESYVLHAVEKMPGQTQPLLLLAQVYMQQGKRQMAADCMARCARMSDTLNQVESFCLMAWQMGFAEEALALAEEKLKPHPCSTDLLLLKCQSLMRLGRQDKAARVLQTVLDIDPEDVCGLWYAKHPQSNAPYVSRMMFLPILGMMTSAVRAGQKRGPLNRLLHTFAFALREEEAAEEVYAVLIPLWRKLSTREKKKLDERDPGAMTEIYLYLLLRLGQKEKLQQALSILPGRRQAQRRLARFLYLTQED